MKRIAHELQKGVMVKPCSKCGETKPLAEFNRNSRSSDGLRCECRQCQRSISNLEKARVRSAKWRAEDPARAKAAAAMWRAAHPEKAKASGAKWRTENPEKAKEATAKWHAANPAKVRKAKDKWNAANPEKLKTARAAWEAANPEVKRIRHQNRRARKLGNDCKSSSGLSKGLFSRLIKLQRGKCACCGLPLGDDYHLDHIMPLKLGGINADANMQLLRAKCNLQKNAKHPIDFMQSKGFLL